MNLSKVAVLNGTPIYAISRKDYIELMKSGKQDATIYYMILDEKNYMFADGVLYGQVVDKGRSVKRMAQKSWREVFNIKEEVVISERPTTDALKTEGSKKLEQIAAETAKAVEALSGSGEAALNAVASAGAEALKIQAALGEAAVAKHKPATRVRNTRKKNME